MDFYLPSSSLDIRGEITPAYETVLTAEAIRFVGNLVAIFTPRRNELLASRLKRQAEFDSGVMPDFLPHTIDIRNDNWKTAPIPADLLDRRVEIIGSVDCKTIINALNSDARIFIADFEDSSVPAWDLMMQGQINLCEAISGTITYDSPEGKHYTLKAKTSVLTMRPRGWHLPERNILQNGVPIPASLADFGFYFFHNVQKLLANSTAPYFCLPKMESYLEARLWNDIFVFAQEALGVPRGTIRATVVIETLPAAFEMDEFLFELREHAAGLLCGRWDYIFNFMKCFRSHPSFVLPERKHLTMSTHFLHSYSQLLINTCHRRGIHAIGGMAAQIPNKYYPETNIVAMNEVRKDKEREVTDGYDGTWVGHPMLVSLVTKIFDKHMPLPNQIDYLQENLQVCAADLLRLPDVTITLVGLRRNISVSLHYLEAWLFGGNGCVRLYDLLEDTATAEIVRTQLWQWIRYPKGKLDDGQKVTVELFREILDDELQSLHQQLGEELYQKHKYKIAAQLLDRMATSTELLPFLTLEAYEFL